MICQLSKSLKSDGTRSVTARSGAVGSHTALQVEKSRVRTPVVSYPGRTVALGSTQPLDRNEYQVYFPGGIKAVGA